MFALATPFVAVGRGAWLFAAAGLVLLSALADTADGAVAVMTGRTTRLGGFYDSLADRVSEAAWLLALWLVGAPGVLVTACGALAWLHEYARARSVAVGHDRGRDGHRRRAAHPGHRGRGRSRSCWAAWPGHRPASPPGAMTVVLAVWPVLGVLGTARLLGAIRATLPTLAADPS